MKDSISIRDLENIELDSVRGDCVDAFVVSADWKANGETLTCDELDRIDSEGVQEYALQQQTESGADHDSDMEW